MAGLQSKKHIFGKEIRLSDSNLCKGTRIGVLNNGKVSCGVTSQNLKYMGQSDDGMCKKRNGEQFKDMCLQRTKHGGGFVRVWGCISAGEVGDVFKIEGIMNAEKHRQALIHHAVPSGRR